MHVFKDLLNLYRILSPGEDTVQKSLQPKLVLVAILAAYATPQFAMAEEEEKITTEKVEVISTTPLPGIGVPLYKIPSNIQYAS